jgi:hypothetical protein
MAATTSTATAIADSQNANLVRGFMEIEGHWACCEELLTSDFGVGLINPILFNPLPTMTGPFERDQVEVANSQAGHEVQESGNGLADKRVEANKIERS